MQVSNCYSYSRVSKASQAEVGLGIQRQQELIENFLKDKPEYMLVDSIQDAGVSGFTGDNILDGAGLGSFINQVKSGEIPENSLLIVESVDRISRGGIRAARKVFSTLLDNKINVALLKMGIIVKHDDVNDISSELLLSVGAYLGFLESKQKSERIKKTFELQREQASNGKKIKLAVRPWLKLSEDQTGFEILPEPLAILERLYQLKLSGLGVLKIAQILNEDNTPPLSGKVWNSTTVTNHLKHRSVLGEYHPKVVTVIDGKKKRVPAPNPILDYYPQVINSDIFLAVQSTFVKANATKLRSNVNFHNLFKGFIKCKCCGGSLGWQQGVKVGGKTYEPRLYCNTRKVGKLGCSQKTFYYPQLETGLVNLLAHLDYSKLTDKKDYSIYIEVLEGKLLAVDKRIDNFTQAVGLAEDLTVITMFTGQLQTAQKERESIAINLSEVRTKAIASTSGTDLTEVDAVSSEGRMKLHKFLSQYVERITTDGEVVSIKFFTSEGLFRFNIADLGQHLTDTLETLTANQYKKINLIEFYKELSVDLVDMRTIFDD
jgi:DNA invertase Pin-like site-specific DNA recombinase